MKHLNVDWENVYHHLPLWRTLPEPAQRGMLNLKNNEQLACELFEQDRVDALIDSGLMSFNAARDRLRVLDGGRAFFKVMRAMHRHRIDVQGDERFLERYASDHLKIDEQNAIFGDGQSWTTGYGTSRGSSQAASQQSWLQQFLDLTSAKAARQWEQQHLPDEPTSTQFEDGSPYFDDEGLFKATQRLIQTAMTWPKPVPLAALPENVPDLEPSLLWRAVMVAVRYLWLFPRLGAGDHDPVIGVWPQIAHLLHRPPPTPPEQVVPDDTFHAPFLIEDMATVLITAAAEPLRLLASGEDIYQKDFNRIIEPMLALPPWLFNRGASDMDEDDLDPREDGVFQFRIGAAMNQCLERGLLTVRDNRKGPSHYETTDAGRDWLSRDIHERIIELVKPWRDLPEPAKEGKARRQGASSRLHMMTADGFIAWDDSEEHSPWMPSFLRWGNDENRAKIDWRAAYADVLTGDNDEQFQLIGPLLEYHTQVNNPLLGRRGVGTYGPRPNMDRYGLSSYVRNKTELQLEDLWFDKLADLIKQQLVPLGAVETGWNDQGLSIRVHAIGRYMLGLADDFDYQTQPEGSVIVQPNFEIVFMGPAPAAEAKLGRLAERTGQRMGAIFRITRRSILAAAAAGIQSADALRDLQDASAKPLPDNIRREVTGWFNSTASAQLRHVWIIEAPDEPTAVRILAAAGKQARRLTPTHLEVTGKRADHTTLIRKLKKDGIFIT